LRRYATRPQIFALRRRHAAIGRLRRLLLASLILAPSISAPRGHLHE
jgi:hypothetical protein